MSTHARVSGFGATTGDLHFASTTIESAFVAFAMRASPYDPITIAVAGAVVGFFGEAGEYDFAHGIELCFA